MLSWEECEQRWPEYCERIGIPATADEFVKELRRQLQEKAEAVDRGLPTNAEVTIGKDGEPVLRKSAAQQITDTGRKAGFGRPAGPSRGSSVATRPP